MLRPQHYFLYALALGSLLCLAACQDSAPSSLVQRSEKRVLLLPPLHEALSPADQAMMEAVKAVSAADSFSLHIATAATILHDDSLVAFSAVVLLNPLADSLKVWQRTALERYVQAGNGLVVMDPDTLTPYLWHWYQQARQDTLLSEQPPTAAGDFLLYDFDGGRLARADSAMYLAARPLAVKPLSAAITFAIGDNTCDYARARSHPAPEDSRFTRVVLDDDIYEPMEMAILPWNEVLFLERRGKIKLYDPYDKMTRVVAEIPVCITGNYEDGLHGLALDPGYGKTNHFLYLYYSPPCDTLEQYLSRFEFKNGQWDAASEVVVLKVPVQRETCCHSGGSIAFGPDSLLYLSTGDNTSSKESDGYTPTDERPGRSHFDAQKSSSNTNDLRGKILRIRPEADGSYSIPEGNLFPPGTPGTLPEIYIMGCRNPFRISIDRRRNALYWGDVGPDGGEPGLFGPESFDEYNRATRAGNYGWPYFCGDNFGYPARDFDTGGTGLLPDPAAPLNGSPNNTGLAQLPPAQPPLLWYPYGASAEFPLLGIGSRSAMSGPFYYPDQLLPLTRVQFPPYYEGKWFIYEWARSWIKLVTLGEDGELLQIEDFLPDLDWSKPIEMEFGPDGALYVLEYGNMYFTDNPDARLTCITFANGNRPPKADLQADRLAGAVPHTVHFSAAASFDHDPADTLSYTWSFEGSKRVTSSSADTSYTFTQAGTYTVALWVSDGRGGTDKATCTITVGNAPPIVDISSSRNRSFYWPGTAQWDYEVRATDEEDKRSGGIDPNRLLVNYTYIDQAALLLGILKGKVALPEGSIQYVEGAGLMQNSDCYTCHHATLDNIGPSYLAVANKYTASEAHVTRLANKIIKGGNGAWGERLMSAHPQLDEATAAKMVRYILSLNKEDRLPHRGSIALNQHQGLDTPGGYVVSAAYRDKGFRGFPPQTGRQLAILRHPKVEAESCDGVYLGSIPLGNEPGALAQVNLRAGGHLLFERTDLRGIRRIRVRLKHARPATISLRTGEGTVVAQGRSDTLWEWTEVTLPLPVPQSGLQDLHFVFESQQDYLKNHAGQHHPKVMFEVDWLWFDE